MPAAYCYQQVNSKNENQLNLNNNRLPQNDSLLSRLASTQQQRIDNQRTQNDIINSQNKYNLKVSL